MKQVWLWLAFIFLYGLFSMKTQAASMTVPQQSKNSGCVSGAQRWSF